MATDAYAGLRRPGWLTFAAVVLISVGVLRLLNTYVFRGPQRVWASYTLLGGIFTLTGLFLWTLRRPKSKR